MDPLHTVRRDVAPYVGESGKAPQDPEVLEAINDARRVIYPLGDWRDTVEPIVLDVQLGTVTLPPWGDAIRRAWQGRARMDIENQWYEPLQADTFKKYCGAELRDGLIDLGTRFAVFRPYDKNFRIKVVSFDDRDEGAKLVFHAISEFGEPVSLTRILQRPHEAVTADPISDKWVQSITAVNKPKTYDRVYVYIFDPVRNTELLCAIYEAGDVNPQLRRYRVPAGCKGQVFAKVKKKFVPLANDDELVDIHTDALIHLVQGITDRKNRNPVGYAQQLQSARNLLDKDIQTGQPMQTFRLKMSPAYRVDNLGFED